jgi:hypothetical protein
MSVIGRPEQPIPGPSLLEISIAIIKLKKYKLLGSDETMTELVRFEVFTVVTMNSGVFWDVMPCGSCRNRRFGGT